tara:strand:+ start:2110 stop:2694 length:585 start_codon:yes stop_codon:yes gene_type:complete
MDIDVKRKKNLTYAVVKNVYTAAELKRIKKEFSVFEYVGPEKTDAAVDNGAYLKDGDGAWVDSHYKDNRQSSALLTANRVLFSPELTNALEEADVFYGQLKKTNFDSTLLNKYSSGKEYKPHVDDSLISAVTFFKTGQIISGGEFVFPEQKIKIPLEDNTMVVFPGLALHGALPFKGRGKRYSMAQFAYITNNK